MRPSISYRIGYHDETNINSVEDHPDLGSYLTGLVFGTSVHTSIDTSLWPYIPDQQWSLHSV
jgi:hypothetical protein